MTTAQYDDSVLDPDAIAETADRIRAAYQQLVTDPGGDPATWEEEDVVPLRLVLAALADTPREYYDAAIRHLDGCVDVELTKIEQPTEQDIEAGVWSPVDGEDFWSNQIWIAA